MSDNRSPHIVSLRSSGSPSTSASEWKVGWRLLLSASIANMIAMLPFYTIGAVIAPISNDTGWSRTTITAAATIIALGTALVTPIVGKIIDWQGPRLVGFAGLALSAVALAAVSLASSPLGWIGAWVVVALLLPFSGALVWVTGVTRQFDRHRGFALGIVLSGVTLMIAGAPLTAGWLTQSLGWRSVFPAVATAGVLIAIPVVYFLFRPSASKTAAGLAADLDPDKIPMPVGYSYAEAVRTRTYWQLMAASIAGGAAASVIVIHFQPVLITRGLSSIEAAALASLMGPAALLGRLGAGWLADRCHAPLIAAAVLGMPAIAFTILLLAPFSTIMIGATAVLGGVAVGGEIDLFAYLSSRCFGQKNFATIHGTAISLHGLGFSMMSLLGGRVFDTTGSYDHVLIPGAIISVIAAVALLCIGPKQLRYGHGQALP